MTSPVRRSGNHQAGEPVRWLPTDPFASLEEIWRRMDQMMRTFPPTFDRTGWPPFLVDIEETDDAYIVEIDLPGAAHDDTTLEWKDRDLTVHGEVKQREHNGFVRQQTRRIGQFDHTVTLPGEIIGEQITATLHDGVLMIRAPKAEKSKTHRIQIGTGNPAG
jgi:HSP20 family protein